MQVGAVLNGGVKLHFLSKIFARQSRKTATKELSNAKNARYLANFSVDIFIPILPMLA